MAIQYNENIKIAAPAPLDKRYLSERTLVGSPLPYSACTEVNTTIISSERYTGLTVNIGGVEYWYKDGVLDACLIEKKYDTIIPLNDYLTGASSMGNFTGFTGIQKLQLVGFGAPPMDNCYYSEYNNYFVDNSGFVRIGEYPHRGPVRRAYVNPARSYSWIYNVGTSSWILTNYDVTTRVSCSISCDYVSIYPNITWSGYVSSGGTSVTATGSLITGGSYVYGAPVYSRVECQNACFRSIVSDTPNLLGVSYDEFFVRLSGTTAVLRGENIGTGEDVFAESISSGTTLYFKRIVGSGDTVVSTVGGTLVVYTSLSGNSSVTGATNIGSTGGTGVFDSKDNVTLRFSKLVGSGKTSISKVGNDVVIYTSGGSETYDLSSPSVIPLGGICSGTVLTGKTAFQLFEELLVPELFQTSVGTPTTSVASVGTTYEVGSSLSLTITPTYIAGAISPLYCTSSPYTRGGAANAYQYIGCCLPDTGFITNISCSVNPYIVSAGTQTWCVRTRYDEGACIRGSKNTVNPTYPTVCPASGYTSYGTTSLSGLYPYYWGKVVDTGSRPPVTNTLVTGGTKVLASSTGTVTVSFSSASNEYTWLAIPATSTSRQSWYISLLDCGRVNNLPTDKYPDECLIAITSGQGCWSGVNYKVYMSKTYGAISSAMEFRNYY
jgi:hypothetical protein